jgi:hypothetical protein
LQNDYEDEDDLQGPPSNQLASTPPRVQPKKTYSHKRPVPEDVTVASNQPISNAQATMKVLKQCTRMSTGRQIAPIPRSPSAAWALPAPDFGLNNDHFHSGHQRATATPQRPCNSIVELATAQLDPSTPAGGSPGPSPTATPQIGLRSTRTSPALETRCRSPSLDSVEETALDFQPRSMSLDAIDKTLVLRMDCELWPIIKAGNNKRNKENVNTPGRFLVRPEWGEA